MPLPAKYKKLRVTIDPQIGACIKDFSKDSVVYKNFFYFTEKNFLTSSEIYTAEEIGLIMNITDREYAELVEQFFKDNNAVNNNDNELKKKELEEKLTKSYEIDDARNSLPIIEAELEKIKTNVTSIRDIEEKYTLALHHYNEFAHLKKYNLIKVHEDLVQINQDIEDFEQAILDYKGEEIEEFKNVSYDKGKIVLAISLGVGIFIVGLILRFLQNNFWIVGSTWLVGLIITLLLIYTAKMEVDSPIHESETIDIEELKTALEDSKSKKRSLLAMLGLKSSEEFFNQKANLGAATKSLLYLKEQLENIYRSTNSEALKQRELDLTNQIQAKNEIIATNSLNLTPQEQNNIKRELDYLKLSSNQNLQSLNKEDIIEKLKNIREELKGSLPDFCNVIRNNFQNNFDQVKNYVEQGSIKLGMSFSLDKELSNFETMNNLQKFLFEYATFKFMHEKDFVFIIEDSNKFNESEEEKLYEFINLIEKDECEFYILNSDEDADSNSIED